MGYVNPIRGTVWNIGTSSATYSATSSATAIGSIATIDDLPEVTRGTRDQTLNSDVVMKFAPGRRVTVGNVGVTVFMLTSGYTFLGVTSTSNWRVDLPTDEATSTAATTYLQLFFGGASIVNEKLQPGDAENEAKVVLTLKCSAVPTFATASY